MNIGIVTTHDEINYGAFFQALFLKLFLEEHGHRVWFITNPHKSYTSAERRAVFGGKNPITKLKIIQKIWRFKIAQRQFMEETHIGSKIYDELDCLIFGSDEIWNVDNCVSQEANRFFMGDFSTKRKISYAASAGSAKSLDDYASYLRAYDKIFVRDENTKRLLKSNNICAEKVLDPTLLIDIPKSITRDIYSHHRNIVVYYCVNQNHDFYKSAKEYALSIGAELVSIGYKHPNAKNLIGVGPIEWLEIMNNSHAVFTDMYHGTIFAAKLQKKLSVNVTEYRRNKMTDLINNLSLWNNVWSKGSSALESSTEAADTLLSFSKERILDAIKN